VLAILEISFGLTIQAVVAPGRSMASANGVFLALFPPGKPTDNHPILECLN
jgi:hypothetical protein